ncbi:HPr family phosphocarrier protein [Croceicoccus esteveae]|uniref:HPr family phosphocarrier protein n=1 Tax=Croceicoccus esteveae TaxID=3075597 RepID=UPI003D78449D
MPTARRVVEVVNQRGLHARASARFVNLVQELPAGTNVKVVRDNNSAAGGSILGLMMLGAARGDTIEIVTSGAHAQDALEKLCALVADHFGEN